MPLTQQADSAYQLWVAIQIAAAKFVRLAIFYKPITPRLMQTRIVSNVHLQTAQDAEVKI